MGSEGGFDNADAALQELKNEQGEFTHNLPPPEDLSLLELRAIVEGQAIQPHANSEEHDRAKCQLSSFSINHQEEGNSCLPEEFGRCHQGAG